MRWANGCLSLGMISVAALLMADDSVSDWGYARDLMGVGVSLLACVLFSNPANRRRVHAALGRLGTSPAEQRA